MKKHQNGFSLFELLVVISIIGILTAVITVSFSSAQKRSKDAGRIQTLNNIQKAAEQCFALMGSYKDDSVATSLTTAWTKGGSWTCKTQKVIDNLPSINDNAVSNLETYRTNGSSSDRYCFCAEMISVTNANYGSADCDTAVGSGTSYYCVRSLQ